MILKEYQISVIKTLKEFFTKASQEKEISQKQGNDFWLSLLYDKHYNRYNFADKPKNGLGEQYPRICLKVPTGGGKTLLAVKAICEYQENFAKQKTGLVVWITHRETIYQQTIKNLQNKNHYYRQTLDQLTQNKTIIVEKGQAIRKDDIKNNLVVLMLMIQSAKRKTKEGMKIFKDNGSYMDFFPQENKSQEQKEILEKYVNLEFFEESIFNRNVIKTSLGNVIRTSGAFFVIDEFHTMFSKLAKSTIDDLNPEMVLGLSATPRERHFENDPAMNVLVKITGKELQAEQMIKIPLELVDPQRNENWKEIIDKVVAKREELEKIAIKLKNNKGVYIRPIALLQAERAGKDQEQNINFVHTEHIKKYLLEKQIPLSQIAIKTAEKNEIKEENLLSEQSEIRYILTKEALKEGWDCSFAYVLGVMPNARTESSMVQLVGRILRQPYGKYTEVEALNKSYVYYSYHREGSSEQVLKNIWKGFEEEGLEDLSKFVSSDSGPSGSKAKIVKIKENIRKKYQNSLYLPTWVITKEKRKFYYDTDIKKNINWDNIDKKVFEYLQDNILNNLSEIQSDIGYLIDLDKKSEKIVLEETYKKEYFDVLYLAKRIFEVVENGFISYDLSLKIIKNLEKLKNTNLLKNRFGFIASQVVVFLETEKKEQERKVFEKMLNGNILNLIVSNNALGYKLPEKMEIYPEGRNYEKNLFEESSSVSMNTLEKSVAQLIDEKESVLWWVRNFARSRGWYFVKGWRKNKIYPDFIIAQKDKNENLKLVYIFESKGEHLIGNEDTNYKKAIFNFINSQNKNIEEIDNLKFKINKNFDFEFIEGEKEELEINKLLN